MDPPTLQTDAPAGLHVLAPAKVNLVLSVLGRRADGFHEIRSVAMAIGLFDELRIAPADEPATVLTCDEPDLPCDEHNLIVRAARALAQRTGTGAGARIALTKRIPVGAGLGGGSSDAAAALRGLNRLWQTALTDKELAQIGAELGSDVPLFFALPAARMSGRGELVGPAGLSWSGWVVLVLGGWPVSTPQVYQAWKQGDGRPARPDAMRQVEQAGDAEAIMAAAFNDLEPAVFRVCPRVSDLHRRASGVLERPVRVSGAGSTVFTLFDDRPAAENAVALLANAGMRTALVTGGNNVTTNVGGDSHGH